MIGGEDFSGGPLVCTDESPLVNIFFPPFYNGGQPKDAQFMKLLAEKESAGEMLSK
jgi:hypothetical protein